MDLLTPGTGLLFWSFVIFTLLFFLLAKTAWKPILSAIREREKTINEALDKAEEAQKQIEDLKNQNDDLLLQAREEREKLIKEAADIASKIKDDAKKEAHASTNQILENAKKEIEQQKKNAVKEINAEVATLSLSIAEKLMRKNLADDKSQAALVKQYLEELN